MAEGLEERGNETSPGEYLHREEVGAGLPQSANVRAPALVARADYSF
jgi:hypothetical protein